LEAELHRRNANLVYGLSNDVAKLEITTRIGCKILCAYCPQDKIVASYPDLRTRGHLMSPETFEKCLDHVPSEVDIGFSGFAEPWLNPDCTRMVLHAASRGHHISIFTTLVGMTPDDVAALEQVSSLEMQIHLPSDDEQMNLRIDETYEAVVERLLAGSIEPNWRFYGERLHPQLEERLQLAKRLGLNARAGNLELEDAPAPRRMRGRIACKKDPVQHVLIPNGDVALCCMDWSLQHVLGNLLELEYEALVAGPEMQRVIAGWNDESQDVLCRTCERYAIDVDWKARLFNSYVPGMKRLRRELGTRSSAALGRARLRRPGNR